MKRKLTLILACAMVFSLLALAGCGGGNGGGGGGEGGEGGGAPAGDTLTIGVLAPTTGSEAYYGTDMLNTYQMAVDEINAAGGITAGDNSYQLVLKQEDDACDAATASAAAAKIISASPDFVVGGYCSGATIPALQQFYDADLIMLVSCANSTNITDLGLEQTFMINSPGTHQAVKFFELCSYLGDTKIALIHQGDDYTKNLSDITTEAAAGIDGTDIVTTQVMEKGAADVSAIVTAINQSGADVVYWCGYHADGSNVIKQLRQGGYEGDIVCGDGSSSVDLITACGSYGEGVYVTSPPSVNFAEGGEDYVAAYKEAYGMEPGAYSTLCYDTIYLLKAAIEEAGTTDYAAVRDTLQNIEYQGMSGLIKFTPDRELAESNFIVLQIHDGAYQLIDV